MQHKNSTAFPVAPSALEPVIPKQTEPFLIVPKESNNKGFLRVAAYIRVSTESSDQEESYEIQQAYFEELLSGHPLWISAGIYSDYGISGTSKEKRTGFLRLLRHCEEGRIDRIITKSISRFARNTRDFLKVLEVLKANQVTIVFEKEHLDTAVVRNNLMFTAFGAAAQEESRSISANIRWGFQKHYARGETGNIPIYGYRYAEGEDACQTMESGYSLRKIEIVEEEAAVVRRIFMEVAAGKTYINVARGLNGDQIPAPESIVTIGRKQMTETPDGVLNPGLDEGWTARHISRIIRLERYAGDVLLQKTYKQDYKSHRIVKNKGERKQYYVKNHHSAIVDRELYREVKTIWEVNASRYANGGVKSAYPFSGRLVCSHCGRFYRTRNRKNRPIWYCASTVQDNGKRVCSAERIYEEQIVRMCRKAVIDRFQIVPEMRKDSAGQKDIFNGSYTAVDVNFGAGNEELIKHLIQRMEMIQRADDMEHDRVFLKIQIARKRDEIDKDRQAIEALKANLQVMQMRQHIFQEEIGCSWWKTVEKHLTEVEKSLTENIQAEQKLVKQLAYMEEYWAGLEADYEWQKKAIAWMRTLPEGQQGIVDFLNGLTDEYVKAFIFSIKVESALKYRVRWFDDTWSDVEMSTNAEAWT